MKTRLLEDIPNVLVVDGLGSSEGGSQAQQVSARGLPPETGNFGMLAPGTCILDSELRGHVDPKDDAEGWLAKQGGLSPRMKYLSGRELAAMYPACR